MYEGISGEGAKQMMRLCAKCKSIKGVCARACLTAGGGSAPLVPHGHADKSKRARQSSCAQCRTHVSSKGSRWEKMGQIG